MNRELGYSFEHMRRAKDIESRIVPLVPDGTMVVKKKSDADSLLSIIYAKDECRLPSGDLQYFVNPKANSEVKKFILDNLMMDISSAAAPKNADIDSDTAFALMRKDGESVESYIARVNEFGRSNADIVKAAKENATS